jgi:prepilin-type N-terminal cleavage/methylation domain-containing protein
MICNRDFMRSRRNNAAFPLIELMVVIAIIGILAALLLPTLSRAKEKAKVARVRVELNALGLAFEMYATDYSGKVPPVRNNCNTDLASHWCELPVELANERYLPHGNQGGLEADLEDVFNPGHTYKYAASGPQLLNGVPAGNYSLWVPTNAPTDMSGGGKYFTDAKTSPVRWAIWSLGPQPNSARTQNTYAPLTSGSWYRRTGAGGVIVRFADRDGTQFSSQ